MNKNWIERTILPRSKFAETPIPCNFCGKDSGYTKEGLMFYVISCDLKCKNCSNIVIYSNDIIC